MTPPPEVVHLVEHFQRNLDVFTRPDYKEARARAEFIDPFFETLGWDVRNVKGYAEQYRDVVHEDAIKVAGATRARDYCFRIGGVRRFFVEAKKPSVGVNGDVARHGHIVALAQRMLGLHKKLSAATIPADKQLYQRQIDATDQQIDRVLYELYGLTEEEIAIVEGWG